MSSDEQASFRLMTFNIGGGRGKHAPNHAALREIVAQYQPELLALQEVNRFVPYDGPVTSQIDAVLTGFREPYAAAFHPTISLKSHLHPGKHLMVDALFDDLEDWQQGNTLISRWPFHRLGKRERAGEAINVPIYRPPNYLGNRDTDPRHVSIARIGAPPLYPVALNVHLTTLVGERKGGSPAIRERAEAMRIAQIEGVLSLITAHLLAADEVVFLMGDFNAQPDERCIADLLVAQAGFTRLEPENADMPTHRTAGVSIDHIFIHSGGRPFEASCRIIDSDAVRVASDHRPVLADVTLR